MSSLQQAHHFAPLRPPSPQFLRTAHQHDPIVDYLSALLPPTPPPLTSTARKRTRSSSPSSYFPRSNTWPPNLDSESSPQPRQQQPRSPSAAPTYGRTPSRSATAPLLISPAPPRRPPSPSSIPFPSLLRRRSPSPASPRSPIKSAASNGVLYSDSPTPATPTNGTPSKPGFPSLSRTPSSAAFVAASKDASVNPLTLQAIARRESEGEALRVVREREERERVLRDGGGSGPGVLRRRESWTRGGDGSGGSGSRTPKSGVGLGLVREGEVDESTARGHSRQASNGTNGTAKQGRRVSIASLSEFGQKDRSNSNLGAGGDTVKSAGGGGEAGAETIRKRSFFARLGGRKSSSMSMRASEVEPTSPTTSRAPGGAVEPTSPGIERSSTIKEKEKKEQIRFAKVKTKNKSTKDFNKLFLAQELFIPPPTSSLPTSTSATSGLDPPFAPTNPSSSTAHGDTESLTSPDDASQHSNAEPDTPSAGGKGVGVKGRKKNAVWSIKFSDDGRYLAVGGKDGVVRVWEVLSTPSARQATQYPDSSPPPSSTFDSASPSASATPSSSPPFTTSPLPSQPVSPTSTGTSATATSTSTPARKKATSVGAADKEKEGKVPVAIMPVFGSKPLHEFKGHEADVLDLSWSKNNFLLSSSMDKTVRLWHVSRSECLCAFQHLDFVTSIAFHPKDDRFFLSGSLDCKLRLWNIPEKRVHIWTELPELITSVAFTRDGKLAIAGSFVGICMFFEVETFRYHCQFAAKSTRGKNSKGRKVTSLVPFPLPSSGGERLLVTSNDSRMRLYHVADKNVEAKYAGHENTSSQIRASFSDDGRYIISGSEDRCVYIWDSGMAPKDDGHWHPLRKSKDGTGYESFSMSANIITCASFAPSQTREILAQSADPVFGDGHFHLQPLQATLSGASLFNVETNAANHLVPVNTAFSNTPVTSGEDAIIVVADDETGVISIFRNSNPPAEAVSSKKSKRMSRASQG
ncbi:hypothetical protein BCR35DRAFT_331266 [Leucosporidium creatinivorum]|uniref:WD40-repeat-containing domain protein n=1 Tax=Leucosporidium creatinivorum TaxID=106004 RepID=A0A1Y2FG48_9BASI|nr:hypothetical protein BCR35DRAFT_331266 [Leucosporidium creatinivorum]